jgi:plastocyanin
MASRDCVRACSEAFRGGWSSIATGRCSSSATTAERNANFYNPKDVTIKVGQSVKWRNDGAVAHTVTSDDDSTVKFDSGTLEPRGVYALKPGSSGKLTYFCTIHGKVQSGTITVSR